MNRITISGFRWDRAKFEKLGFQARETSGKHPIVNLIHERVSCATVPMLLEMGRAGLMYVGYIEIPYHLLVADGRRSMAVDSIVGSDYPALLLSEDGSVIGLEKAREFLDIRVLVKRTFREVVSQL